MTVNTGARHEEVDDMVTGRAALVQDFICLCGTEMKAGDPAAVLASGGRACDDCIEYD